MVGRARSCILDIGGDLHHARIKAIAQCFGALGPVIYGALIGDGSQPFLLFLGYLLGAAVMMAGGLVAWFLAVASRSACRGFRAWCRRSAPRWLLPTSPKP